MKLTLERPWLELRLPAPQRVLSWSLTRPGFAMADLILWRQVRNADLPPGLDVAAWLRRELAARGRDRAVAMLTSRDLDAFERTEAAAEGIRARCVATVGLSNAERVGVRLARDGAREWGTINIAVILSAPLSEAAQIEALSIAAQARTAAVIDTGLRIATGIATGTGTDCIAVAAPAGRVPFAGLHTAAGEAVGRAVYDAVRRGAQLWMETVHRKQGVSRCP